jgi:hypothetical protein
MGLNLRSPRSTTLYLAMLFMISVSLVNCNLAAYLSLIPDGEINMATAPGSALPQALSKYISHGDSVVGPSL